ncbi:hypothetical protein CLF_106081 [Clonorchis sinensis]|uniref:G-protein coupled receptors family 1 profile domain-containing protein n=1 Tax=Clonorchis sinensis TaxID=79923 RepID=G7YEN5_CLOSI|nr:hypothetical protein CLF_106081 [Clonorchis sinensis]
MVAAHLYTADISLNRSLLEQLWMINNSQSLEVLELYDQSIKPYILFKHCVTVPITLLSMLCIIITIVVVTRRGIWRPTVTYIIVLASVDLCTVTLHCLLSLDTIFLPLFEPDLYTSLENVVSEVADTLLFISNWLTTILATERFIAICYPLQSRRIGKRHRKVAVLIVILLSVIVKLPGFLFHNLSGSINNFLYISFLHRLYVWIVQLFLFLIIPFAILTFVNIRLIIAIRKSANLLRTLSGKLGPDRTNPAVEIAPGRSHTASAMRMNQSTCFSSSKSHTDDKWLNMDSCNSVADQSTSLCDKSAAMYDTLTHHPSEPSNAHTKRAIREERKITITLICLVVTFFLFQGPFVLTSVITRFTNLRHTQSVQKAGQLMKETVECVAERSDVCANKAITFETYMNPSSIIALALKSDLYFVFYCWFCERFLKSLRTLFRPTRICQCFEHLRQSLSRFTGASKNREKNRFPDFCVHIADGYRLPHHQYSCPPRTFRRPNDRFDVVQNGRTRIGFPYDYRTPPLPFVLHSNRRKPANILKSFSLPREWHEKKEHGFSLTNKNTRFANSRGGFHMPPNFYCSQGRIVISNKGSVRKPPYRFGSPGRWSVKTTHQKHSGRLWPISISIPWSGVRKLKTVEADLVHFQFSNKTLSKFYNDTSTPSTSATRSQKQNFDNEVLAQKSPAKHVPDLTDHTWFSPLCLGDPRHCHYQGIKPTTMSAPVSACYENMGDSSVQETALPKVASTENVEHSADNYIRRANIAIGWTV